MRLRNQMEKPYVRIGIIALVVVISLSILLQPFLVVGPPELVPVGDETYRLLLRDPTLEQIQQSFSRTNRPVDKTDVFGGTLLSNAAELGRLDVAEWLLANGANPNLNADRSNVSTPRRWAWQDRESLDPEILRLLDVTDGPTPPD